MNGCRIYSCGKYSYSHLLEYRKTYCGRKTGGLCSCTYGKKIIPALDEKLKLSYGSGYGKRNLAYYRKFYLAFPNVEILHACVQNLSWSHLRLLIHVENEEERMWYMREATEDMWSVRTLERNITTQYYGRRLASQKENLLLPSPSIVDKYEPEEYIKNPIVAEFLGFRRYGDYTESELLRDRVNNKQRGMRREDFLRGVRTLYRFRKFAN